MSATRGATSKVAQLSHVKHKKAPLSILSGLPVTHLEEGRGFGAAPVFLASISSQKNMSEPYHQSSDLDGSAAKHSGDADLVIFGLTDAQTDSDLAVALTRYSR